MSESRRWRRVQATVCVLVCGSLGFGCLNAIGQEAPPDIRQDRPSRDELDTEPSLQGVPDRVEWGIVDTTTVAAERSAFSATSTPVWRPYVALLAKERPWNFAQLRPQQRRVYLEPITLANPNATVELAGESPGRVRYDLSVTDSDRSLHGAMLIGGERQSDTHTQDRGSLQELDVGGVVGWEDERSAVDATGSWRTRSLNWLSGASTGGIVDMERTVVTASVRGDHAPQTPGRMRTTWRIEGLHHDLANADRSDTLTDASARVRLEVASDVDPWSIIGSVRGRRIDAAFASGVGSQDVGIASIELEDRSRRVLHGVLDLRVGVAGFRDPELVVDDENIRLGVPFRVGWTTVVDGLGLFRLFGGQAFEMYSPDEYSDRDFVVLNEALPTLKTWNVGMSFWRHLGRAVVGGSVAWVDSDDLPIWEELDAASSGVRAWRPVSIAARRIVWDVYARTSVADDVVVDLVIRGERPDAETGNLPYRPSVRGALALSVPLPHGFALTISADWQGKRHRDRTFSEELDAYVQLGTEISKELRDTICAFVTTHAVVGTYLRFDSEFTDDAYDLSQSGIGFGIRTRL